MGGVFVVVIGGYQELWVLGRGGEWSRTTVGRGGGRGGREPGSNRRETGGGRGGSGRVTGKRGGGKEDEVKMEVKREERVGGGERQVYPATLKVTQRNSVGS